MIIVVPLQHFLLPLRRHPLSVVLHAKDEMSVLPHPRDCNTSAALRHLNAMPDRILHERLQNQLRYIASVRRRIDTHRDLQAPCKTPLLDLQIGTQEGQFLRHRHKVLHAH